MEDVAPESQLHRLYRRARVGGVIAAGAILLSGCEQADTAECRAVVEDREGATTRFFKDSKGERVAVVYTNEFAGNDERRKQVRLRGYGDHSRSVSVDELPQEIVLAEEPANTFQVSMQESAILVECASTLDS